MFFEKIDENLKCTAQIPVCLPCSLQGGTAICMQGLRPFLRTANPRARFCSKRNQRTEEGTGQGDTRTIALLWILIFPGLLQRRTLDSLSTVWQLRSMLSRAQIISIVCQPPLSYPFI